MLCCRPIAAQGLEGQYKVFARGVLVVLNAFDCNRRYSYSSLESSSNAWQGITRSLNPNTPATMTNVTMF